MLWLITVTIMSWQMHNMKTVIVGLVDKCFILSLIPRSDVDIFKPSTKFGKNFYSHLSLIRKNEGLSTRNPCYYLVWGMSSYSTFTNCTLTTKYHKSTSRAWQLNKLKNKFLYQELFGNSE